MARQTASFLWGRSPFLSERHMTVPRLQALQKQTKINVIWLVCHRLQSKITWVDSCRDVFYLPAFSGEARLIVCRNKRAASGFSQWKTHQAFAFVTIVLLCWKEVSHPAHLEKSRASIQTTFEARNPDRQRSPQRHLVMAVIYQLPVLINKARCVLLRGLLPRCDVIEMSLSFSHSAVSHLVQ